MRARFKLEDVYKTDATLIITMPLGDWMELEKQIPNTWPSGEFKNLIWECLRSAQTHFDANSKEKKL